MFKQITLTFAYLLVFTIGQSQAVKVKGKFLVDSIKIGEAIPYSLTASYPKNLTLLFPDTTFAFTPFEIEKKSFFSTKTINNISYDSVVYQLLSFEIDSTQRLALPIFVVHKKDCTLVLANEDTVYLKHLVAQIPDSVSTDKLPLKINTTYQKVKWIFNYPIVLIVLVMLSVTLTIVWLIFGKRIRKYYTLKKLKKNHLLFIHEYANRIEQLKSTYTSLRTEALVLLWKKYIETLEGKPFTKYTTKEILRIEKNEALANVLHQLDRMIYGNISLLDESLFQYLKEYAEQSFENKIRKLNHG